MATYVHKRIKVLEYRTRKLPGSDEYRVIEYYKGDMTQTGVDYPTREEAEKEALRLAERDSI